MRQANRLARRRLWRWLPPHVGMYASILPLLKPLLGVPAQGHTAVELLLSLLARFQELQPATATLGLSAVVLLWSSGRFLAKLLVRGGFAPRAANLLAKLDPMVIVLLSLGAVAFWQLDTRYGVAVIGTLPQGLPSLQLADCDQQGGAHHESTYDRMAEQVGDQPQAQHSQRQQLQAAQHREQDGQRQVFRTSVRGKG